jgi:hypothetical protein
MTIAIYTGEVAGKACQKETGSVVYNSHRASKQKRISNPVAFPAWPSTAGDLEFVTLKRGGLCLIGVKQS